MEGDGVRLHRGCKQGLLQDQIPQGRRPCCIWSWTRPLIRRGVRLPAFEADFRGTWPNNFADEAVHINHLALAGDIRVPCREILEACGQTGCVRKQRK